MNENIDQVKNELINRFKTLLIEASQRYEKKQGKTIYEQSNDDYFVLIALSNAIFDLENRLKKFEKWDRLMK